MPTVLITVFFGLFGAIPAYLHGKRAEELGGSSSPYWKAFGISLAASLLAWIAIVAVLAVFLFSAGTSVSTVVDEAAPTSVQAPPEAEPAGGPWTAVTITPALDDFADDEADDLAAFSDTGVIIPCGGQWASGSAPDLVERTSGGARYLGSAEILPDAASAGRELDRLRTVVAGCGEHDVVMSDGGVVTGCDAPVVASLDEVVRYEQACDFDPTTYAYAIFQADNAVVAMAAPSVERLDGGLAAVRSALALD